VAAYTDGVGNRVNAIQWDGDMAGTWPAIQSWTKRAHINRRGVLCIQTPSNLLHAGINDWLLMDSNHAPQVFLTSNGQFTATYRPSQDAIVAAPP
jgi:hypothetical protein